MSKMAQLAMDAPLLVPRTRHQDAALRTRTLRDACAFAELWDPIQALRKQLQLEDDVSLNPLYFLATTDHVRRPCAVACWRGDRLIGVLFATERHVRGFRSGYGLGGDYTGRGLLICHPQDEAVVIAASVQALMADGLHSLHLRMLLRDQTRMELPGMRATFLDARVLGDRIALPSSFEQYLRTLGKHTRRNVRYYTRKTVAAGIQFEQDLAEQEYETSVARLNAETDFPANERRLARDRRLLMLNGGTRRFGLRGPDGVMVAVLCGFTRRKRFHLLTQLNDAHLQRLSLSVVLRGYVIQHLIDTGHTELQFMGGSSLSLGRFCKPQQYRSLIVDRKTGVAAVGKSLGSWMVKFAARIGKPLPVAVQTLCRGFLDESSLSISTALGPSAVAMRPEAND